MKSALVLVGLFIVALMAVVVSANVLVLNSQFTGQYPVINSGGENSATYLGWNSTESLNVTGVQLISYGNESDNDGGTFKVVLSDSINGTELASKEINSSGYQNQGDIINVIFNNSYVITANITYWIEIMPVTDIFFEFEGGLNSTNSHPCWFYDNTLPSVISCEEGNTYPTPDNSYLTINLTYTIPEFGVTCSVCNETCSPCGGGCNATNLDFMFLGITGFDSAVGNISGWNTSCITSMYGLFAQSDFNQDISSWDVSNVTDMGYMFSDDPAFNQPMLNWDVRNVWDMEGMFKNAVSFNQDIGSWNTTSVMTMAGMFTNDSLFSANLSTWETFNVETMASMFENAVSYEPDLTLHWAINALVDATDMYKGDNLSVASYSRVLDDWGHQGYNTNVTFSGGYSQYSYNVQWLRDSLTNTRGWIITDGGVICSPNWFCSSFDACSANVTACLNVSDLNTCNVTFMDNLSFYDGICCSPNWNCSGYGACNNSIEDCNAVTDLNTCNDTYMGNYSEFMSQICLGNCTPNWNCSSYSTSCVGGHKACNGVGDSNLCNETYMGNYSEFTPQNCNQTGYTAQYGAGDLGKITIDALALAVLEVLSFIGTIVIVLMVVFGVQGFKKLGGK